MQSVGVDRQLKFDMQVICQRKGCEIGDPYQYCFFDLWPDDDAKHAFNKYVECKWPIHVFSLDPVIEQQNQLDLFSQRTELQLALATAVASGQVSFQNATSYARRIERDLAAINLNRTAIGFGAGEATYGWRFYPRYQAPPTQSNPRRILSTLVNNGPSMDYTLNKLRLEPGQRECYALVLVPSFAPQIKLTTITNWFDLKTCHPDQELRTTDMINLSRKVQTARSAMQKLCDSGRYRPVDFELLGDRLTQLEAMLPMQSHDVELPFEADLTGSEIFTSFNAALGPRLLTWFGEPGGPGGSVFLLGTGFTVRDMKVVVGGVTVGDSPQSQSAGGASPSYELVSRNIMRVDIPPNVTAIRTPVVFRDPSFVCFDHGHGKTADGGCDDCAKLKRAPSEANIAAYAAVATARQADVMKAQHALNNAIQNRNNLQALKPNSTELGAAIQVVRSAEDGVNEANATLVQAQAALTSAKVQPGPSDCECKQRWVVDIHVASSNGISNHLLVEVPEPGPAGPAAKPMTVTVTTSVKPNAADGSITTTTNYQTTTPGILPPGTFFPINSPFPAGATFVSPGATTINALPAGSAAAPAQSAAPKAAPAAAGAPAAAPATTPAGGKAGGQASLGAPLQPTPSSSRMSAQPAAATGRAMSAAETRATHIPPPFHGRKDPAVVPASTRSSAAAAARPRPSLLSKTKHTTPKPATPAPTPHKSILSRIFGHTN